MPRNRHLRWNVNYQPGKLEAVAYKKGKRLTKLIETTGAAAKLIVTPSKQDLVADGKDAVVVNISVADNEGREVPDVNVMAYFTISGGNAKIIGTGNGDPSSHEQDRYNDTSAKRSLFNGKCQVIIQAGKEAGKIKFTVSSDGLTSQSYEFNSITATGLQY